MAIVSTPTSVHKPSNNVKSRNVIENIDQDVNDTYGNWALVDTRDAESINFYITNTDPVADQLDYKIQFARKDDDVSNLVDGDFSDIVAETTMSVGAEASYTFVMAVNGYSAMRLQLKNTSGAADAKATTYVKAFY